MAIVCKVDKLYGRILRLLIRWSRNNKLLKKDQKVLQEALEKWRGRECPQLQCRLGNCRYREPLSWLENRHGYLNVYDIIKVISVSKPLKGFPYARGMEILDAKWPRQPGHYNP